MPILSHKVAVLCCSGYYLEYVTGVDMIFEDAKQKRKRRYITNAVFIAVLQSAKKSKTYHIMFKSIAILVRYSVTRPRTCADNATTERFHKVRTNIYRRFLLKTIPVINSIELKRTSGCFVSVSGLLFTASVGPFEWGCRSFFNCKTVAKGFIQN